MADRWYTARMATKEKPKKKQTKPNRTAGKKVAPMKKALKKKLAQKRVNLKKKLAKKAAPKKAGTLKKQVRGKSQVVDTGAFTPGGLGARAGGVPIGAAPMGCWTRPLVALARARNAVRR